MTPQRFGDQRGWFAETYNCRGFAALGIDDVFVQDNHSFSARKGTLRGLHFQAPPHAQAKIARCVRGRIFDVAVDIRMGSPTFGHHLAAELSADNGAQLYIPVGFAHGFLTLEENCEVLYKASDFYEPASEGGVIWNDADLALPWPLDDLDPQLSPRDLALLALRDIQSPFTYDGRPLLPIA